MCAPFCSSSQTATTCRLLRVRRRAAEPRVTQGSAAWGSAAHAGFRLARRRRRQEPHPRHSRVGCTPRSARRAVPTCWLPPPRGACAARRARRCATARPHARERLESLAHTAGRTPPPSGAKPAAKPALNARQRAAAAAAPRDGGDVCGRLVSHQPPTDAGRVPLAAAHAYTHTRRSSVHGLRGSHACAESCASSSRHSRGRSLRKNA